LTLPERLILTRLSVFKGGWTLEAAEAICVGGDPELRAPEMRLLLTRLVNKSLISYDTQSGRYSMLESVKAFVGERLEPAQREALRTAHFRYFSDFALRAEAQILGNEQTVGLRAVQADSENFAAALDARDLPDVRPDLFLRLARSLNRFWYIRGHFKEGYRRLQEALDLASDATPLLRCQVLNAMGSFAFGLDDLPAAEAAFRAALATILATGTRSQIAAAWDNIALACSEQGRVEEAESAFLASLTLLEECADHIGATQTKLNFAYHHIRIRLLDRAEELCLECLDAVRGVRDRKREAVALHNLGEIAYFRGRFADAKPYFVESIRIKEELGDRRGLSLSVYMYALVLLRQASYVHAAALFAKSLEVRSELGIAALPMPKDDHEAALAEIAAHLGPDVFAEAWDRGRELFDEEAIQTITTSLQ
jgi:tetratricopeptide (TPR) repeat protein